MFGALKPGFRSLATVKLLVIVVGVARRTLNRKVYLRHHAVFLRQHSFLVVIRHNSVTEKAIRVIAAYRVAFVQIEASKQKTQFSKEVYENVSQFDWKNFTDRNLTRQLSLLTDLGVSVLPVDEVLQVSWSATQLMLTLCCKALYCYCRFGIGFWLSGSYV